VTGSRDAPPRRKSIRRWIRLVFLLWAVGSTTWLANSMRTKGVDATLLQSSSTVTVVDGVAALEFVPTAPGTAAGLVFICGAGVGAAAYAPLLRPIADAGYPVFIVKLPYRFAPLASHRAEAIARARSVLARHPSIRFWVVAGHSRGAALAAQMTHADPRQLSGLVLIGTTHPRDQDLSSLPLPVIKIYGTNDDVAPAEDVLKNARLLPPATKFMPIEGGNHSQFGHYGPQLFDGTATITRDVQQSITRSELLAMLAMVAR
jgi:pimeloyl-ACP methyl ester carboxylesterase